MQFSEKWLRSFVDPEIDTAALSHLLTMAGLEVEELDPAAAPFTGVVVAEVLSVAPHPDADRLCASARSMRAASRCRSSVAHRTSPQG